MAKTELKALKVDDMAFEMDINGHKLVMDANSEVGGKDLGPRPKPLLLAALVGCTGMDVSSILKKMQVDYNKMEVSVEADNTEEHPKVYENIKLIYKFQGKDLPKDKIEKAIELSQERYCGVSAMLGKATTIDYEIVLY